MQNYGLHIGLSMSYFSCLNTQHLFIITLLRSHTYLKNIYPLKLCPILHPKHRPKYVEVLEFDIHYLSLE